MGSERKRILLADDDISDRGFLTEIICQIDKTIKVDIAANGQQVFQYLAKCREAYLPCLVILDYSMPDVNGIEVLQRMKAEDLYSGIPTVLWSAFLDNQLVSRSMEAGAANCFPKPSRASELKAIAIRMLEFCHLSGYLK
jgi:CheY-like chemotaxis protein